MRVCQADSASAGNEKKVLPAQRAKAFTLCAQSNRRNALLNDVQRGNDEPTTTRTSGPPVA
jgi:hypothetical protein